MSPFLTIQTSVIWWFIIIMFIGIGFIAIRFFLKYIKFFNNHRRRLESVIAKKTEKIEKQKKDLEEEKKRADQILYQILPDEVVNELKNTGKITARSYKLTSVLFTDVIAFTRIAEKISPQELVRKLEAMFTGFDRISDKYQIERIKTIGDSYMAVGGVPIRSKSNPIYITLAALEMLQFIKKFNIEHKDDEPWRIRIGINSGELTAGVLGLKRYQYDIWGNTVNLASRMETKGEGNKINISGNTYDHIKPFFDCTYRGKLLAKNVGYVDMYFVNGIKPELSINEEGLKPNDTFYKYLNLYMYSKINYQKSEKYIIDYLKNNLPSNLYYHDINHTINVCESVEKLALMEGVYGEELFLLKTAALFHDAGFVKQYKNNESIGAELAKEMLPQFGFNKKQVKEIINLIYATIVPHNPKNLLEQLMCDADLDYLGRDDFHEISERLYLELKERNVVANHKEWDKIQIMFLEKHQFYTASSIRKRKDKKLFHLNQIKERLEKDLYTEN